MSGILGPSSAGGGGYLGPKSAIQDNVSETVTNNTTDLVQGEVVRLNGNGLVTRSQADVSTNLQGTIGVTAAAITAGGRGLVTTNGRVRVLLVAGLAAPAPTAGQTVYVSAATAGRATNAAPAIPLAIGIIKDASSYGTDSSVIVDLTLDTSASTSGLESALTEQVTNVSGGALANAEIVRMSGNDSVVRAQGNSLANLQGTVGVTMAGIANGALGEIASEGKATVTLDPALAPAAGDFLWLSTLNAGRATTIAPPQDQVFVGIVKDAALYAGDSTVVADIKLIPNLLTIGVAGGQIVIGSSGAGLTENLTLRSNRSQNGLVILGASGTGVVFNEASNITAAGGTPVVGAGRFQVIGGGLAEATALATPTLSVFNNATASLVVRQTVTDVEGYFRSVGGGSPLVSLGTSTAHSLTIDTNNATAVTVDTSQRVGIGAAPSAVASRFQVIISGAAEATIVTPASGAAVTVFAAGDVSYVARNTTADVEAFYGVSGAFGGIGTSSNNAFFIASNNTIRATFAADGSTLTLTPRVGIGGAPTGGYDLDVMASAAEIRLASSSGASLSSFDFVAGTANATVQLWGQTAAGTIAGVTAATSLDLAAVGGPMFLRTTTAQNMYLITNSTLAVIVDSSQRVGIAAVPVANGGNLQVTNSGAPEATTTASEAIITGFTSGAGYLLVRDVTNNVEVRLGIGSSSNSNIGTVTNHTLTIRTNNADRIEITNAGNIALFAAPGSYGSGTLVLFVANASANPSANPTGGGILYATGGAGTWRGSGGTVTTFGPAGPHCAVCGKDEWTVATLNTVWKTWRFVCGNCGEIYAGGPADVRSMLTTDREHEYLTRGMIFEDVARVIGILKEKVA